MSKSRRLNDPNPNTTNLNSFTLPVNASSADTDVTSSSIGGGGEGGGGTGTGGGVNGAGAVAGAGSASKPFMHRKGSHSRSGSIFSGRLTSNFSLFVATIISLLVLMVTATKSHFLICPQLSIHQSQQPHQILSNMTISSLAMSLYNLSNNINSNSSQTSLNHIQSKLREHIRYLPPAQFDLIPSLEAWKIDSYARSRLGVYVYELPSRFNRDLVDASHMSPSHIRDPYCDENFYSSEVHVHQFLLKSAVRVADPAKADFFYVPIYSTCDLINSQPNNLRRTGRNFRRAMAHIIDEYPFWNESDGRDHIFLFSQGFSARLAGDWTFIKNAIFLVHNGEFTALEYTAHKDITIPPELRAYFQPVYRLPNSSRPSAKHRRYLAQFGGQVVDGRVSDHRGSNYSRGVRQYIRNHLTYNPSYRITGVRSPTYLSDMTSSKFCLAPEGWHPWSPRPYYSIQMGCIPVIISDIQELAFEEFVDWDSFAVWIRPDDVNQLDAILRNFTDAQLQQRRDAMERVWRVFWYDGPDALGYQAILQALYNRKLIRRPQRRFSRI